MANLRTLLQNVSPKGKAILGASVVGVAVFAFLLMRIAGQPSYATMLTGLDPADTGKITAALDEQGIGYELQNNGTALAVEKSQTAQARIALSKSGLPGKGQPGFELFDKQKLGASSFQQQVNYQRALEGEIARTIQQVDGISGAQVQLVLPQEQLFADEQAPATAAVLLTGDPAALEPGAVRGVAQLVASSVKGLKPQNVSITDQTGTLLWPTGEGGGAGSGAAPSKQTAEARYEQQLESSLNALIVQTLGPGKAQVQVKADLNADLATQDKLVYAKRGVPLRTEEESETLRGSGSPRGAAGTNGNIPAYQQGGGGNSNYKRSTTKTDFGVDKTVTRTKVAPGQVNRLGVALLVDKSVPAAELAALRTAVQSAAGIDAKRGDTLAVSQVAFAKAPAGAPGAAGGPAASVLGYAKYVGLALATLLFLFFVRRHLRRREHESLGSAPTWLREIEAPRSLAELEGQTAAMPLITPLKPPTNPARMQVEEYAAREPERVAAQVRQWLQED